MSLRAQTHMGTLAPAVALAHVSGPVPDVNGAVKVQLRAIPVTFTIHKIPCGSRAHNEVTATDVPKCSNTTVTRTGVG